MADLQKRNTAKQEVAIFAVGMGPAADYAALKKIGLASGGWYYRLDSTGDAQKALLDGPRRNRQLGAQSN